MPGIPKSAGTTPSERYLATLAGKSFLSLWSYPNVFRDQGKELCDVLVVCGDYVLVFSDKSIKWSRDVSTELAWSRWYRRAIGKSADQLKRAMHWIGNHPDRLFLDSKCAFRFPIELPPPDRMKIYGVIVARGASKACIAHFGSGSGSLVISPEAARHLNNGAPKEAFTIGNPCLNGDGFYHVFDDISLNVVLEELDTIHDLARYLTKKESLFSNGSLIASPGEEDLLALYMKDVNEDGEHDFVVESGKAIKENQFIVVEEGAYDHLRKRDEYRRKKEADRVSYIWDYLIERFAQNIINDTPYLIRGYEGFHEPSKRKLGIRYMALTDRLERRMHGDAIMGAFSKIGDHDRFFRATLPGDKSPNPETGFFILLLKRNTKLASSSDDDYRLVRANIMYVYAMKLLSLRADLKRVVGIATEGEIQGKFRSEDVVYAEQPVWNPRLEAEIEQRASSMGVFKDNLADSKNIHYVRPMEYPPSHHLVGL